VRPMFSFHSDLHRRLSIETADQHISADLLEDTGWWRGSNLYRHESGAYVLHEGQAGCLVFTISPVAVLSRAGIPCEKQAPLLTLSDTGSNANLTGSPASRFYPDFSYIGSFLETTGGETAIKFLNHDEQPEVELPDIL
jgi:hypothetical protein